MNETEKFTSRIKDHLKMIFDLMNELKPSRELLVKLNAEARDIENLLEDIEEERQDQFDEISRLEDENDTLQGKIECAIMELK